MALQYPEQGGPLRWRVLVYSGIGADLEDQFLLGSTSGTDLEDQFLLGYASDLPPARSKDRLYFHKIHTFTILDPEALCWSVMRFLSKNCLNFKKYAYFQQKNCSKSQNTTHNIYSESTNHLYRQLIFDNICFGLDDKHFALTFRWVYFARLRIEKWNTSKRWSSYMYTPINAQHRCHIVPSLSPWLRGGIESDTLLYISGSWVSFILEKTTPLSAKLIVWYTHNNRHARPDNYLQWKRICMLKTTTLAVNFTGQDA